MEGCRGRIQQAGGVEGRPKRLSYDCSGRGQEAGVGKRVQSIRLDCSLMETLKIQRTRTRTQLAPTHAFVDTQRLTPVHQQSYIGSRGGVLINNALSTWQNYMLA